TNILKETVSGAENYVLEYLYDESGVAGIKYNGSALYFIKNLQGDVIALTDDSSIKLVQYTYDAWGNVISITGGLASLLGNINPIRYRGYYYDTDTGYYYLNSRYYDPAVGRFLNADGIVGANGGIQGYNMYAYCNNNPVVRFDPSGYDAIVVTEGGLTGHMGILVEDENGQWYHFYWGDSMGKSSYSIKSCSPSGADADTWCERYDGELTVEAINASGQYGEYDRMIYICGDYSSCIEEMNNPSGKYNLAFNNCVQKCAEILASAEDTKYDDVFNSAKWYVHPTAAHIYLDFMIDDTEDSVSYNCVASPIKKPQKKIDEIVLNRYNNEFDGGWL
ncbi:MAG: RHS repeat-associated core domain-containing protein, partial [Clostridia bacterium]|nr:RHS repeat-associated core domain-containing protein [Clostridia bacterium]